MYCHHCLYDCFLLLLLFPQYRALRQGLGIYDKMWKLLALIAYRFPPFQQWCGSSGEGEDVGEIQEDRAVSRIKGNMKWLSSAWC